MAAFDEAVAKGPYAFAFLNRGLAHLRRSNVAAGVADLEQAKTLWPSSPDVLGHYGWGLAVAGRTAEAEQALRSTLELRPDFPRALGWLAWVLESQARWSEAIPLRERLVELEASEANRGALERARARASGPAVAAVTDSRWDLVLQTGLAAVVDGRFEEGARLLEGVRLQLPPRADLLFTLGFALQKLERHDAAREAYGALLEIDPRHVRGTFNLAFELLTAPAGPADLERSAELFHRTGELDPGYGEALFREASALRALGRNAEADLLDAQYLGRPDAHPELRRVAAGRLVAGASTAGGPV
jgi:tetratricopeptide (TPR) repeat protein